MIYEVRFAASASQHFPPLLIDVLEGPGNPSLQFPTRCVHNLAIDWLDENYIASCATSNESTVCVWDRRVGTRLTSPSLGSSATNFESIQNSSVPAAQECLRPQELDLEFTILQNQPWILGRVVQQWPSENLGNRQRPFIRRVSLLDR